MWMCVDQYDPDVTRESDGTGLHVTSINIRTSGSGNIEVYELVRAGYLYVIAGIDVSMYSRFTGSFAR